MKRFRSWTICMMSALVLIGLFTPVSAFANTEESVSTVELREKYIDKMELKSEDVLGFYHTSMEGSAEGRISNIEKAMKKINGEKINPNEVFSYNEEVGNSNIAEDGWEKAGVILNGQLVDDYGGGICQVSSTLYNAAAEAGMTMVERNTHSKNVGYVPVGQDATVAYGLLDFKFQNPFDYPVKIKAKTYDDNHVVIAIVRA